MAEYSVGASGGDFQDTLRRAQAASTAMDELNRKEAQRQASEERTSQAEGASTRTRTGLAGATTDLTTALERNTVALDTETGALQRNVTLMERSIALRREVAGLGGGITTPAASTAVGDASLAEVQRVNQLLEQRAAIMRTAAVEAERMSTSLRAGVLGAPTAGASPEARAYMASQMYLPQVGGSMEAARAAGLSGSLAFAPSAPLQLARTSVVPVTGGPADPVQAPTAQLAAYREEATRNAAALDTLAQTQRSANLAFNEAGAIYADTSQALSRHGALTTEFIQAFARGQVTLKEFESQMVSTIGKFGGWAIAGGAVYGVFKLFQDLKDGAVETQAAVQQLGRFIPGLGGPAGGGNSQIAYAQSTVRDISTQFNVPIKEVVDNMQVMARVFHSVADAGDATRAVLAVSRLDQVSPQSAQQYLIGIAQSQGITQGSGLIGVVNSLNALQSTYGARVSQTLPALARAAPAAYAAGTDLHTLEALSAMGVRSGLPGNQVGTALLRSMGTFAFRPTSEMTFREFGLNPQIGQYGDLIGQVMHLIDSREKQGNALSGPELTRLAQGLGGPLLGTRSILPLLVQEQLRPGAYDSAVGTARNPRNYQEDLNQVLGTITERFKSIGIALQNFGGMLAQAGILTPITALFDAFGVLVRVTEAVVSPLTEIGRLFNQLPGPLRDAVGALIAFRAARGLYNTTFGSAAQSFVGRLPGLASVRSLPREAVEGTQARLETYLIPEARNDAEAAARRLRQATQSHQAAVNEFGRYQAANADLLALPQDDPRYGPAQEGLTARRQAMETAGAQVGPAEQRVAQSTAQLAELTGDLVVIKDKQYSFADRAAYLEQQGYVALAETVSIQEEILAAKRADMAALRGGGGVIGGGGVGRGAAAAAGIDMAAMATAAGVAAPAAADALANDPTALGNLQQGLSQAGLAGAGAAAAARGTYAPTPAGPRQFIAGPTGPAEVTSATTDVASRLTMTSLMASAQMGAATVGDRVSSRLANLTGATGMGVLGMGSGLAEKAGSFFSGPGLPIAGLIGTQMLGSTFGGGLGNYIQNVGGSAFGGMMLMQMLGKGDPMLGLAAGAILGNVQQGAGPGIGAGAGALVGGGLGLLGGPLDALTVPAGAAIGSIVGGVLGSVFGGGGSSQSPQDLTNQGTRQAIANLRKAGLTGKGQSQFGDQFSNDLVQSALGSGQTSQNAQARVQATIRNLTAQIQLFGGDSPQGKAATTAMNSVIGAAVSQATVDPSTAYQLVQSVTQARNQEVQRQLQYNISVGSGAGSGGAAAAIAGAQYKQIAAPFASAASNAQQAVSDAQQQLGQLQDRASGATGAQHQHLESQVSAARKNLATLEQTASVAKSMNQLAQENATLQEQQAAQMGYQADIATIQGDTQLAVSQAGGNVLDQLKAQVSGAQKGLSTATDAKGLDPRTRKQQMEQYQAQLLDLRNKQAQQGLTELQSEGQIAEAKTPIGDPAAQAETKLKDLERQYQYVSRNKKAFDPSQINDLLAQVIQAKKDAADAAAQFATQMSDLQTHIAQAQDFGNAVAQAADAVAGASRDMKAAVTPAEKAQAYGSYLDAVNQQYQAQQETIKSQGALQAALVQGDPLAAAQVGLQTAEALRNSAKGTDNIRQAETDLVNAEFALSQARFQRIQTLAQVNEAQVQANPVAVARVALNAAHQEMQEAQGWQQQQQARKDLYDAQFQLSQAVLNRDQGTTMYQLEMMQINAQQAIQQLQALLKMRNLTLTQQQSLRAQIRQIQLGQYNVIGGSAANFDLAPSGSNIAMPTVYDIRRAMGHVGGRPTAGAPSMLNASAATQVNVFVNDRNDVPHVVDAIDRATGSQLRARMRAAGVRGV